MKWLILIWPLLATISFNRNEKVENIAIVHTLVASYVAWGVITGIWTFPGTWEKTGVAVHTNGTEIYGWLVWVLSILMSLLALIDKDIRFDFYLDARFPAKHRQISYLLAFFGVYLIAFSGGHFNIPLGLSVLFALIAISGGMDVKKGDLSE